jgi:hypothetical protein
MFIKFIPEQPLSVVLALDTLAFKVACFMCSYY